VPSGVILLWSGSVASIPSGWLLCDGSSSTPDLRNRFIVGAGSSYAVAATGGSADATLVSHTHTATVTDPGHTHTLTAWHGAGANGAGGGSCGGQKLSTNTTVTSATNTTGISVANSTEGSSATNANLPPYYALAYIMKA
jgi:microcystin-dependent protein